MLAFLRKKLVNSDGFILDIFLNDGSQLLRTSLNMADEIGLVIEDTENELRLIPWTSIQSITFEEP